MLGIVVDAIDADDVPERSGAAGCDTRRGVFEHSRVLRRRFETAGGGEERVRLRLATKRLLFGDHTIDADIKQIRDVRRSNDREAVSARGHHRGRQSRVARRAQVGQRTGVRLYAIALDLREENLVLASGKTGDCLLVGTVIRGTVGQIDAACTEEGPHAVHPWPAVDEVVIFLDPIERGEVGTVAATEEVVE